MKFHLLILSSLFVASTGFVSPLQTFAVKSKPAVKKSAPAVTKAGTVAVKPTKVKAAAKVVAKKVAAKPVKAAATVKAAPKKVVAKPAPKAKPTPAPKAAAPKPLPRKKNIPKKQFLDVAKKPPVTKATTAKTTAKRAPSPARMSSSASPRIPTAKRADQSKGDPSPALPYSKFGVPSGLDGSLIGDAGFDPAGFATTTSGAFWDRNGDIIDGLQWNREAEIIHGRIGQVACVGFIWPELYGTIPGGGLGDEVFSNLSPIGAISSVPGFAWAQIFIAVGALEIRRLNKMKNQGDSYQPGDAGLGQTGYNPFKFKYTPEQYDEKRLQELKHCRLGMLGAFGLLCQANASGEGVVAQLGGSFDWPEYINKAGYYFPEGI